VPEAAPIGWDRHLELVLAAYADAAVTAGAR
jgi:hypothetical protein